jgi:hypothetical protein
MNALSRLNTHTYVCTYAQNYHRGQIISTSASLYIGRYTYCADDKIDGFVCFRIFATAFSIGPISTDLNKEIRDEAWNYTMVLVPKEVRKTTKAVKLADFKVMYSSP